MDKLLVRDIIGQSNQGKIVVDVGRDRVREINNRIDTDITYELENRGNIIIKLDMNHVPNTNKVAIMSSFFAKKGYKGVSTKNVYVGRIIGYQIRTTYPKKIIGYIVAVGSVIGLLKLKMGCPRAVRAKRDYRQREVWPIMLLGDVMLVRSYGPGLDIALFTHLDLHGSHWIGVVKRLGRVKLVKKIRKLKRKLIQRLNKLRGYGLLLNSLYLRRDSKVRKKFDKLCYRIPRRLNTYMGYVRTYRSLITKYTNTKVINNKCKHRLLSND